MSGKQYRGAEAFGEIEKFLYALRNAGSKYSLGRIEKFARALGNPHLKYPSVHVAGTNGKGSVCAMCEAIFRGAGLRTGMFTSPHLVYLGERVQIDRRPIEKEELAMRVLRLRELADGVFDSSGMRSYPSFFEFMTALAFDYFAEKSVDVGVFEVGLGGRLDSTNILRPDVCAITSIGLDHTELLGNSLESVAGEKAGILKPGVPAVCGFLPEAAMRVVEARAREVSAPLYRAEDFFPSEADLPRASLSGAFQRRNAAVALLIARVLRETSGREVFAGLDENSARGALMGVSWPARWESVELPNGARLILDSSHNAEGARSLEENLSALCAGGTRPVIALGVLGRERAVPLLEVAAKYASRLVFFVPNQPRALSFEELESCMPAWAGEVSVSRSSVEDFYVRGGYAKVVGPGETLVSTGSIYLAGEVLAALGGVRADLLQDRP